MLAYLIVANFYNAEGTIDPPEIWLGAVGETPENIHDLWLEHLNNFKKGQEAVPLHVLAVDSLSGVSTRIPWKQIEQYSKDMKELATLSLNI